MFNHSKENLRDLLLKFIKNEEIIYKPIKVEAVFDKSWKLSDDCGYYLKSSNMKDSLDVDLDAIYQVTLKKWRFVLKTSKQTKMCTVDLRINKLLCCRLENPKFLKSGNANLMDDKMVHNAIKLNIFNKTQIKPNNERMIEEKLHKKIQKSAGVASSKFENLLKDHSELKKIEYPTKLNDNKIDKTIEKQVVNSVSLNRPLDEPGFSCSVVNFFEAVTCDQFDPFFHHKSFLQQMSFNWIKSENKERIINNEGNVLDDCQRHQLMHISSEISKTHLFTRNSEVPHVLLQKPIEVNEILWGITKGVVSWRELDFPIACFEKLKENKNMIQFD